MTNLFDLHGRVALITGGAGHIGQAMAESLAQHGCGLALVDQAKEAVAAVAATLSDRFHVPTFGIALDLAEDAEVHALPRQVAEKLGRLDILINNAAFVGTSQLSGWCVPFAEQSTETWRKALEVNLTAPFTLCREAAPYLKQYGKGSIINIASLYGVAGPDMSLYDDIPNMGNPAAYAASKGGLIQLTRWLSTVLAPDIRVNSVCPGGVWRNQNPLFVERYQRKTPLGRMATEDDFKGITAWLASDASAYVTGQNIMVDGGWTAW